MADEQYVVELRVDLKGDIGNQISSQLGLANQQFSGFDSNIEGVQRKLDGVGQSNAKLASGLASTRYALYDVSQTLAIMGAGLLAIPVATYAVAIAWERDFANVIRTSGAAGNEIQQLRNDFMDLASEIPATSSELAEIGTLAGQLGIRKGDIADFTETVAKFSATTDVSVEKSAEGFGRLNSLLPDVQGNFNALGSSVLKVGVNSVATEGEILKTTTQLSSMSKYAGITAGETVGLAAALASVGVPPELSRGTITRLFTLMGRAVSDGGDQLQKFAGVAGVSADQFASAWGTNKFDPIFMSFVNGLGSISQSGGDAVKTLNDLGITSVRDVPTLTKLAQAADSAGKAGGLLNQTVKDGVDGFKEASTLSEQYATINSTVAAKLQILTNNFQNLLVTIGQGGGVFAGFLDILNGVLKTLTSLAANPIANFFLQSSLIITGLVGILTLLAAGAVAAVGSVAALATALVGLQTGAGGATVSLSSLTAIMASTGTVGRTAAAGVTFLSTALKGLGFGALLGGVAAGLGAVASGVIGMAEGMAYAGAGATTVQGKVAFLGQKIFETGLAARRTGQDAERLSTNIQTMGATFDTGVDSGGKWLSMLDDLAKGMPSPASALSVVVQASKESGIAFNDLIQKLPGVRQMFDDAGVTVGKSADGLYVLRDATGQVSNAQDLATQRTDAFARSMGISGEEAKTFSENLVKGSASFFSFGEILKGLQDQSKDWAEQQAADAGLGTDAWQQFYDGSSVSISDFSMKLQEQIVGQQQWASNISILTAQGATAFATELAKMGPEGAALAQAAVNATGEELQHLEDQARLAAFLSSQAFADQFSQDTPMLIAAWQAGGLEAVQAMISAQSSAAPGAVEAVISKYNIQLDANKMKLQAESTAADRELQAFKNRADATRGQTTITADATSAYSTIYALQRAIYATSATIPVGLPQARAAGGYISGPGTATSDSIPARLSNGEFVVRADSVKKYGVGYLNALNQGRVQRYAAGGSVSSAGGTGNSVAASAAGLGITELGPKSLRAIGGLGGANVSVMLDDVAISRAAERGNQIRRRNGEL